MTARCRPIIGRRRRGASRFRAPSSRPWMRPKRSGCAQGVIGSCSVSRLERRRDPAGVRRSVDITSPLPMEVLVYVRRAVAPRWASSHSSRTALVSVRHGHGGHHRPIVGSARHGHRSARGSPRRSTPSPSGPLTATATPRRARCQIKLGGEHTAGLSLRATGHDPDLSPRRRCRRSIARAGDGQRRRRRATRNCRNRESGPPTAPSRAEPRRVRLIRSCDPGRPRPSMHSSQLSRTSSPRLPPRVLGQRWRSSFRISSGAAADASRTASRKRDGLPGRVRRAMPCARIVQDIRSRRAGVRTAFALEAAHAFADAEPRGSRSRSSPTAPSRRSPCMPECGDDHPDSACERPRRSLRSSTTATRRAGGELPERKPTCRPDRARRDPGHD